MSNLTSSDEQRLLESVKQAVHYVDDNNMSPNDAIVKVARDMSLSPGFVRAAVSAFNNGRQVSQWNANETTLDKLAEFPIADYDTVHRQIWGKTEKEANDVYTDLGAEVHSDYQKAPMWAKRDSLSKLATMDLGIEKKAEDEVPEYVQKHQATKQANATYDSYAKVKRAHEEARVKHSAARDNLTTRLAVLTNYFKKFAQDRIPFDVVDKAAQSYYGAKGEMLMDIMAERFPKEKRASDTKRYWDKPLPKESEPFTSIERAIKAASDLSTAADDLQRSKEALDAARETLVPFAEAPTAPKSAKDTTFSISLIDSGVGEKEARNTWTQESWEKEEDEQEAHAKSKGLEYKRTSLPKDYKDPLLDSEEDLEEKEAKEDWCPHCDGGGPKSECIRGHADDNEEAEKSSGLVTGMLIGNATKPLVDELVSGAAADRRVAGAVAGLEDLQHDDELRKIKAQVMLAEMMGDPDNPISEYEPEQVLNAYNELTQLAPRLSQQPAAMQPLLAKRLAGNVEPFEVKEIGDMERGLQQTQDQNILNNNASILN